MPKRKSRIAVHCREYVQAKKHACRDSRIERCTKLFAHLLRMAEEYARCRLQLNRRSTSMTPNCRQSTANFTPLIAAEMARILRFYGRFFEIEVHILLQKRFCRR